MSSLNNILQTAQTDNFRDKVKVATVKQALAVYAEPGKDMALPRYALAMRVLQNPSGLLDAWAMAVAAQDLVSPNSDTAVTTGVTACWNAMAGA